jgi:hypothetical protein
MARCLGTIQEKENFYRLTICFCDRLGRKRRPKKRWGRECHLGQWYYVLVNCSIMGHAWIVHGHIIQGYPFLDDPAGVKP